MRPWKPPKTTPHKHDKATGSNKVATSPPGKAEASDDKPAEPSGIFDGVMQASHNEPVGDHLSPPISSEDGSWPSSLELPSFLFPQSLRGGTSLTSTATSSSITPR